MERYDVEKHRRFSPKPNPNPSNLPPARSPSDSSLSSCRSSLSHGEEGSQLSLHPSPPLAVYHFPDQLSSAAAPNRSVPANPVTVTEPIRHAPERFPGGAAEDGGGGGVEVGGVSSAGTRRMKTPSLISRRSASESAVKKAALGFRFFGFAFCLVSFSVMAADRNKGWAIDSFNRYIEFRYCIAVNAIGVLYSALQGLNLAYQLSSGKLVSGSHPRYIFDFTFDQELGKRKNSEAVEDGESALTEEVPNMDMEKKMRKVRQACFKTNYKKRKSNNINGRGDQQIMKMMADENDSNHNHSWMINLLPAALRHMISTNWTWPEDLVTL